jgi:hypothetical protein
LLTELHSVDDSLSIKTLTSFWDPNGHPGPELTCIIHTAVMTTPGAVCDAVALVLVLGDQHSGIVRLFEVI